ncbi:hypothetical protein ACIQUM_36275 [Amycolatopsis azurea]|uniref:hypothetical protein n=1 Tax=Amycolatopsis azurea TaxID=36819 RepID=UPI003803780C
MTAEESSPVSAAADAARVLKPVATSPPADQETPQDGTITRIAEQAALIHALEQELKALTQRVRKLERARPATP